MVPALLELTFQKESQKIKKSTNTQMKACRGQ